MTTISFNEDKEHEDKLNYAVETGLVCELCQASIDNPYQQAPSQCSDCYDPTPNCHACNEDSCSCDFD